MPPESRTRRVLQQNGSVFEQMPRRGLPCRVRPFIRPGFPLCVLLLLCGAAAGWGMRRLSRADDAPAALSPGGPGEQRAGRWRMGKRMPSGGLGAQPVTADAAAVAAALAQADAATLPGLFAAVDRSAPTPLDRLLLLSLVWQRWMEVDPPAALAALHQRTDLPAEDADEFLRTALLDPRLDPVTVLGAAAALPASARRTRWLGECTRAAIRRDAAMETVLAAVPDHPPGLRTTVEAAWLQECADSDPASVIAWVRTNAARPDAGKIAAMAFRSTARENPAAAMQAALALASPFVRAEAVAAVMDVWLDTDPDKARAAALALPPSPVRARCVAAAAKTLAATDPQAALNLLPEITLPGERLELWESLVPAMFRKAPERALALLEKEVPRAAHAAAAEGLMQAYTDTAAPISDQLRQEVQALAATDSGLAATFAAHWSLQQPEAAFQWAAGLPLETGAAALSRAAAVFAESSSENAGRRILALKDAQQRAAALAGALQVIRGDAHVWAAQFPADDLERAQQILRHGTAILTGSSR